MAPAALPGAAIPRHSAASTGMQPFMALAESAMTPESYASGTPSVDLRAHPRGVGHVALDHLHKHVDLPFAHPPGGCRSVDSTLLPPACTGKPPPAAAPHSRHARIPGYPNTREGISKQTPAAVSARAGRQVGVPAGV